MQEIKSNSMKVAKRRRLAMLLSALTLSGAPAIGLLCAFAGSQGAPEGIVGAVGIRYLSKATQNSAASSVDLRNSSIDPNSGSQVRTEVQNVSPAFAGDGDRQAAEPKSEPAMKWELPTRSAVPNDLPVTPSLETGLTEQTNSTASDASHAGALTVNFGQPKRWVLPPVTVRAESPSNSEVNNHPLSQVTTPEIAKPSPVAIGSLVARSPEAIRSNRVEIPTSLPAIDAVVSTAKNEEEKVETVRAYSLPNMVVNSDARQLQQSSTDKIAVPIKWIMASHESVPQETKETTVVAPASEDTQASSYQPRLVGSYLDQLNQEASPSPSSIDANKPKLTSSPMVESPRPSDLVLRNPSPTNAIELPPAVDAKSDLGGPSAKEFDAPNSELSTPEVAKKSVPSVARLAPQVVTSQPTVEKSPAKSPVEVVQSEKKSLPVKVAEPKLVAQEAAVSKSEPQVSRLTPMVLQQPEIPVVQNRVENPPIAAATKPTWDSISDQDAQNVPQPIEVPKTIVEPYIAMNANEGESVATLDKPTKMVETTSASTVESDKGRSSEGETMSVQSLPTMPTAEIALLTLEKLEPVDSNSSNGSDASVSSGTGATTVYSLSDHSSQVSESTSGGVPSSGLIANPIPESLSSRSSHSTKSEPTVAAPTATSVGIAKVEMTVGERRSLRLAVPIANSDVADQKVCLVHKANAHELILQPLAAGLTSVTIWFRNPANGVDSQLVVMLEVREVVAEVAEIVVAEESRESRSSNLSFPPRMPSPPASVIEPVVSNTDRNQQVEPQSSELAEAIRKAFPNVECELRWDSRGELHVHGRAPDDLTAKRLLSLVRQSYLVPVHDKILIEP